tara:strand:- start:1090 stop:3525 length:2436 start_codon:yes stop_codon:yes gene_type:complete
MEQFPKPLEAMRAFKQFVLWKAVASKSRPGKFDKFPCNIEGNIIDAHNPAYWNDADTALTVSNLLGDNYGVGFVLTDNDPFFFVDIDGAYDGEKWNDIATELCTTFAGCAIEVSHSGRGLHIFGTGRPTVLTDDRRKKAVDPVTGLKDDLFDIYTEERFAALTGMAITGDVGLNVQSKLDSVVDTWLTYKEGETRHSTSQDWTATHDVNSHPILSDEKLIAKALNSSAKKDAEQIFGNKTQRVTFKDLWENNTEVFKAQYPHDQIFDDYDKSAVDAALAQHLAFWTGGNCERIEKLMRGSALVREKWDYHKSYMGRTITGACARQTYYYNIGAPIEIVDTSILIEPVQREGYQLLSADQQIDMFKGCVYIAEINKIFTPNGSMLKSEQFNSMYGGYNFVLDGEGDNTTKKAWEAFTESQCLHNPKVDSMTFRPDKAPHSIIETDGWRYVNTYVPIETEAVHGDVTPFKVHLAKVLPDERDQTILLSYMAACIQYKGYKIQWAPLLQGVVGNGKTLFTRCVAHAIGERYTHMPPALEISEKFNSWLFNTMFIGVEDIYVPSNKLEMIETLKPMITNKRLARRAMNTDQAMHNICCNFMFNSNHKDGIKDATKDRRYCVFYSAQQEKVDLIRDGMDGKYFSELYLWLDKDQGYAKVSQFLMDYAIPDEFNPTMSCQTAPTTSSTAEAATIGMGSVEQEVIEAIEEGRTGFAGGWVSSFALDKLIELMRKGNQIPRNKRRELMRSLGYDYHPGLKDGRVNNVIAIEYGKPRLYIKAGHVSSNFTSGAEIARQYAAAQGDVLAGVSMVDNPVKSV